MPRTAPQSPNATLAEQQAYFAEHGFVVLRGVIDQGLCGQISEHVMQNMQPLVGPAEFEADVGYPGAPVSRDAPGGKTPRRLLHAYALRRTEDAGDPASGCARATATDGRFRLSVAVSP